MNFKSILSIFVLSAIILNIDCTEQKKANEISARVEPTTTALLVSALVPVVTNALSGLFQHITKPLDYQDTVIYGRSMRVKMCNEEKTCVQITDRASGITEVGTGSNTQEAIGDASKKMFDELLSKNLLSLWDLCHLHITFPHPDQNTCPGYSINPCDLIHPVVTTPVPCHNQHGDTYCEKNKARCNEPMFHDFMRTSCLKTCSGGACTFGPVKPVNPCVP